LHNPLNPVDDWVFYCRNNWIIPATRREESFCLHGNKRKVGATSCGNVDSLAIKNGMLTHITASQDSYKPKLTIQMKNILILVRWLKIRIDSEW
jgi:predicted nuclease of predicted toxin-antitoxin system